MLNIVRNFSFDTPPDIAAIAGLRLYLNPLPTSTAPPVTLDIPKDAEWVATGLRTKVKFPLTKEGVPADKRDVKMAFYYPNGDEGDDAVLGTVNFFVAVPTTPTNVVFWD